MLEIRSCLFVFISLLSIQSGFCQQDPKATNFVAYNNAVKEVNINNGVTLKIVRKTETSDGKETKSEVFTKLARQNGGEDDAANEVNEIGSITLVNPGLDARTEITNYNRFMDAIFKRMNSAIRAKNLDPMDLKLLPNEEEEGFGVGVRDASKAATTESPQTRTRRPTVGSLLILSTPASTPSTTTKRTTTPLTTTTETLPVFEAILAEEEEEEAPRVKVRGWLHGMSTLKRSGDVSIVIQENYRTIQCPFALGPLELKVSKTFVDPESKTKRTKSATATTDLMLGMMDLKINRMSGQAEITNVFFDEPGGVAVKGSVRRRVVDNVATAVKGEKKKSKYRLILARAAADSIKKVAKMVVRSSKKNKDISEVATDNGRVRSFRSLEMPRILEAELKRLAFKFAQDL